MPSKVRSRNFAFTYHAGNDYIEECEERLLTLPCKYLIFQYELGKEGTVHLQGFCTFENKMTFTGIQVYCPGIHIESAKASALKNIAYCSKLDTRVAGPYEHGERPCQGYRSDLAVMGDMIKGGMTVRQVVRDVGMNAARVKNHLMVYAQSLYPERDRSLTPEVHVLWGAYGAGKTRPIYEKYGDNNVFRPLWQKGTVWWDSYVGQQVVLFDDWPLEDADDDVYKQMVQWTDRYPMNLNVKGGSTPMGNSIFYITANSEPRQWFHMKGPRALERRFTSVTNVL